MTGCIRRHPQRLSEEDIWALAPLDRYLRLREFRRYRHEGLFIPPSQDGIASAVKLLPRA